MVISLIALFVALGGTSYAALTITGKNVRNSSLTGADLKNSSVTGRDLKNSSVTSGDIRNGSLLRRDFKAGQLPDFTAASTQPGPAGPAGPKGDTGATGPQGPAGADAINLWALIDADTGTASVVRGSGVTGAASPGTGRYVVTFDQDISTCGIGATLGDATAASGSPGEISLDQPSGNSVEVNTYDSSGGPDDPASTNGFYIQVFC